MDRTLKALYYYHYYNYGMLTYEECIRLLKNLGIKL